MSISDLHKRVGGRSERVALAVVAWLVASSVQADPVGYGVPVGPFRLFPEVGVEFNHESNFFRTDGSVAPAKSTWINVLVPTLRFNALKGPDAYNLSYLARVGTVFSSRDDDYVDQAVNANGNWEFGQRHRLRAEYEFLDWHDRRGSGDPGQTSAPNFTYDHPDRWNSNRAQLNYSFGSPGAQGRLDLAASETWRRYINNDQETRDNDRAMLDATYFWRILPKTSLLFDVNWQDITYVNEAPGTTTLDSQEWRLYGGATWDATAKTTGTIKFGYVAKDFQASAYEDYSSFGWEANLQWRPRTYSIVNLVTARDPLESATEGSYSVVVSRVALDWVHYWRSYLRTKLGALGTNDEYLGEDRVDHRYQIGLGLFYQPVRRIELGVEFRNESRTSDLPETEYNNNVLMLTLDARY